MFQKLLTELAVWHNKPVFLFDEMFMSISFNLNPFLHANWSPSGKRLEQNLPVCYRFCFSELQSTFDDNTVPCWETNSLKLHRNIHFRLTVLNTTSTGSAGETSGHCSSGTFTDNIPRTWINIFTTDSYAIKLLQINTWNECAEIRTRISQILWECI